MPTINTLGPPAKRTEFSYSGSVLSGVAIHYNEGNVSIPARLFEVILENFRGQAIPGGFSMTSPTHGGLGEWVQNNSTLSPRHASHIAAILVHEGFITSNLQRNAVYLYF